MILNSIAGLPDMAAAPPEEHKGYDLLNAVLHGRFAAGCFVKAAILDVPLQRFGVALGFSRLRELMLHFGGAAQQKLTDEGVEILATNLPLELEQLFLGFQGCRRLTDRAGCALAEALGRLTRLRRLELRLSSGPQITDVGVQALGSVLERCGQLRSLSLDISQRDRWGQISEAACAALAQALEKIRPEKVHISLASSSKSLQRVLRSLHPEAADAAESWELEA
ncbi:unnamed protein product [Effrenium voratum]|nr:unnamed protein product [Effrenium voratum]